MERREEKASVESHREEGARVRRRRCELLAFLPQSTSGCEMMKTTRDSIESGLIL